MRSLSVMDLDHLQLDGKLSGEWMARSLSAMESTQLVTFCFIICSRCCGIARERFKILLSSTERNWFQVLLTRHSVVDSLLKYTGLQKQQD